jgi:hypothetical protein
MGEHRNSRTLNVLGGLAALVMLVAAGALVYSWLS